MKSPGVPLGDPTVLMVYRFSERDEGEYVEMTEIVSLRSVGKSNRLSRVERFRLRRKAERPGKLVGFSSLIKIWRLKIRIQII